MIHPKPIFCVVFLTIFLLRVASAQVRDGEFDISTEPKLKLVFTDDFRIDSRSDYRIDGDVGFSEGELILGKDSSIEREIGGSPWAKIELDLKWPDLTVERPQQELRIWFRLDGASDCYVLLKRELQDGKPVCSSALMDTVAREDELIHKTVRKVSHSDATTKTISFEYRYGLVSVVSPSRVWLSAFIDNGNANCSACAIQAKASNIGLTGFSSSAKEKVAVSYSSMQMQQLGVANRVNARMLELYRRGKVAEAAVAAKEVLELRKSVLAEDHPDYTSIQNTLAVLYMRLGKYKQAKPLLVRARDVQLKLLGEKHPVYTDSINNLAGLYQEMGNYDQARSLFISVREIQKNVLGESSPRYSNTLNNLASVYERLGKYRSAEPLFQEACDISKNVLGDKHLDYARALNNLGRLYTLMGKYKRAEPLIEQARKIRMKVLGANHPSYISSLGGLGFLYQRMGEYEKAELLTTKALELQKKTIGEEHPDYAHCLINLATLYRLQGDFERAETVFVKALKLQERLLGDEHPDYVMCLSNLAIIYSLMGDHGRAAKMLAQAGEIEIKVKGEESIDVASSLHNRAANRYFQGQYAKAESLYVKAREIQKKMLGEDSLAYANTLNNLAALYRLMGKYRRTQLLYTEARDILRNVLGNEHLNYSSTLASLGETYQLKGEITEAKQLYWRAFEIRANIARSTINTLSEAQALNWIQANAPRTDLVLHNLRMQNPSNSSEAYKAVWQTKSSVSRLRVNQSLENEASAEAKEIFGRLRDARLKLAKLVSATPKPDQAAQYRKAFSDANETKERLEKELASVNPATKRALAIRDASVGQLLEQLPPGVAVVDLIQVDVWKYIDYEITFENEDGSTNKRTVKKNIPTLVYDAFVLRSDSEENVSWIQLGEAEQINTTVNRWRSQLTGRQQEIKPDDQLTVSSNDLAGSEPSADLRRLVWQKLEPHLDGCHTVIILPDGALNRVPWAALPGRKPDSYLVEDYALATANYGQQLFGLLTNRPPQGEGLLVAGRIRYDQKPVSHSVDTDQMVSRTIEVSEEDRNWPYLKGAEREADAVSGLWKKSSALVNVSGTAASEGAVSELMEKSRYAHLATHGFFDRATDVYHVNLRKQSLFETQLMGDRQGATVAARNPLLMTGIVLSGANIEPKKNDLGLPIGSDGILTAEEIVGLRLRDLELITLSACETGLGDVAGGQGVFGLTRALHQAGARSVVSSLWKVSDKATEQLMIQFYSNLWEKKMSKVEALRQAQLWILHNPDRLSAMGVSNVTRGKPRRADPSKAKNRQTSSVKPTTAPRLWAAFQLSGDWR